MPPFLRRGDWHPTRGTWVPTLLAIQFLTLGQAMLRGADYVRGPGYVAGLDWLTPPPLWVWGCIFCGFATLGLLGIVGHWGNIVGVGHAGVALAYLMVGVSVLEENRPDSIPRIAAGAAIFAGGAMLARYRAPEPGPFVAVRLTATCLLIAGGLGVIDGLGPGFRTATGLLVASAIHGVLGLAVLRIVRRQTIRAAKGPT